MCSSIAQNNNPPGAPTVEERVGRFGGLGRDPPSSTINSEFSILFRPEQGEVDRWTPVVRADDDKGY
jgi:hypothetical protein